MSEEPTCKICGNDYVIGLQEDEERHSRVHDEAEHGLPSDMKDGIHFVFQKSPQQLQVIAQGTFLAGRLDTHYDFSLFEAGEQSTNDPVAALHISAGRVIAGVLTRLRSCDQRVCLPNFKLSTLEGSWVPSRGENIERHRRRAIEFIWVLKKHRGKGILDISLTEIERNFRLPLSEFSHSLPFTEAALKFWRKRLVGNIYIARPFSELPEDWPYRDVHNSAVEQLLKGSN